MVKSITVPSDEVQLEVLGVEDPDVRYEATLALRAELTDLAVTFGAGPDGETPAGAKGVFDAAGTYLLLRMSLSSENLKKLGRFLLGWVQRQQSRSVKMTLDGDSLEIDGLSTEELEGLLVLWIDRHARSGK